MSTTYLLRLVLPDRPGSLGAVATALGLAGVDIEALDVVERNPHEAVDDLVVRLPAGAMADALVTAAESVPDVRVESVRPHPRAAETIRDLEVVDALAGAPERALRRLVSLTPEAFHSSWAMVFAAGPDAPPELLAVSVTAPPERDLDAPWLPLATATVLDPAEPWVPAAWQERGVELAAAPVGDPGRALLLGRSGGPRFRPTEIVRLAHLAGIAGTVLGGRVVAGPVGGVGAATL